MPPLLAAEVALRLLLAAEATAFPAMVAVWAQRRHLPWAPALGRDTALRLAPVAEPFRRLPTIHAWADGLLCFGLLGGWFRHSGGCSKEKGIPQAEAEPSFTVLILTLTLKK